MKRILVLVLALVLVSVLLIPPAAAAGDVQFKVYDSATNEAISATINALSTGDVISPGVCVPSGQYFLISADGYWSRKFYVSWDGSDCYVVTVYLDNLNVNPYMIYPPSLQTMLPGETKTLTVYIKQKYGTSEGFENFALELTPTDNLEITKVTADGVEVHQNADGYWFIGTKTDNMITVKVTVKALSVGSGRVTLVPHGEVNGKPVQNVMVAFLNVDVQDPNSSSSSSSSSTSTSSSSSSPTTTTTATEPPFSVQMPGEWQVGMNELRIVNTKAESYVLVLSLRDAQGTEVWSDSYGFRGYEAKTFYVEIPREGQYTLSIYKDSTEYKYEIEVSSTFKLISKEIYARENESAEVVVKLSNYENSTKYYTISISNEMLNLSKNKTVQVEPGQEMTVSIPFQVPANLTYDAYNILVQVREGDNIVYEANAVLKIQNEFQILPVGATCGPGIMVLLALLVAFAIRQEGRGEK